MIYDWQSLEKRNKAIFDRVHNDWKVLLDGNHNELVYHKFISQHSGFFFSDFNCYLTISKLKLGSEYEADFVNIRDKRSNGVEYEFIEIEKPGSLLFTQAGIPGNDLNNAIQQIRDWKRFLIDDKSFFRKFLPGNNTRVITNSFLKFSIIIGRRTENDFLNDKRSQIAAETGVEIRSFDYLTDLLQRRCFYNFPVLDSELGDYVENHIENPFVMAVSDSKWKDFCRGGVNTSHFYKNNLKAIIQMRKNNELFKEFISQR